MLTWLFAELLANGRNQHDKRLDYSGHPHLGHLAAEDAPAAQVRRRGRLRDGYFRLHVQHLPARLHGQGVQL